MRHLALIAAGALLPLAFAPFDIWPAAFVATGLGFWLIRDVTSWRQGLLFGWLIGVGKYAVGASWIYVSIHEQGGASESLAGVLVGVFVAGMALFSGLFGVLFALTNRSESLWLKALGFTAAWTLADWSLTWLLTGFPWLFAGYGVMNTPLIGYAPILGVLGLGALTCWLAALAAAALPIGGSARQGVRPGGGWVVAVWLLTFAAGFGFKLIDWVTLAPPAEVALVQGNIDQSTKWDRASQLPIISRYEELSRGHWDADLIVWPEAAITVFAAEAGSLLSRWKQAGQTSGSTLVLGLPDVALAADGVPSFQNTAQALGSGSGRYIKRRLVPFGEYVPLESLLRGLIGFFDLPMSRSTSGPKDQPPLLAGEQRLGIAICYEIAYPELVRRSASTSDVLVTISNDAWFGASIGPHQHLQLARMRAIENGRYVLRGTNNGLTAIIDQRGRLSAQLPQFVPDVLRGGYRPARGYTPFTRTGHWPLIGLLVILLAWLRVRTVSTRS